MKTAGSSLTTIDEVAEFLRLDRGAAREMLERGETPGVVRLGSRVLFRRVEVRQLVGLPATSTTASDAAVKPILVDIHEAAKLLGTTVEALKKNVQRHQLPKGAVVRIGDRVKFNVAKLGGAQ